MDGSGRAVGDQCVINFDSHLLKAWLNHGAERSGRFVPAVAALTLLGTVTVLTWADRRFGACDRVPSVGRHHGRPVHVGPTHRAAGHFCGEIVTCLQPVIVPTPVIFLTQLHVHSAVI